MADDLPYRKPSRIPEDRWPDLTEAVDRRLLAKEIDRLMEEPWRWHIHWALPKEPPTENQMEMIASILRGDPPRDVQS